MWVYEVIVKFLLTKYYVRERGRGRERQRPMVTCLVLFEFLIFVVSIRVVNLSVLTIVKSYKGGSKIVYTRNKRKNISTLV